MHQTASTLHQLPSHCTLLTSRFLCAQLKCVGEFGGELGLGDFLLLRLMSWWPKDSSAVLLTRTPPKAESNLWTGGH